MSGHYVVACLAGEWVAFASDEIESVVEIGAIVPVPCAAPHVAGLAALRSRVLTVIDCSASVMPGTATEQPRDALVVVHCGHAYALLVDRVEDALEASGENDAFTELGRWMAEKKFDAINNYLPPRFQRVLKGRLRPSAPRPLLIDGQKFEDELCRLFES